jgi:hypothetical protein
VYNGTICPIICLASAEKYLKEGKNIKLKIKPNVL